MPPVLIFALLAFWCFLAYRALQRGDVVSAVAVSYTHLTLPTICSV